MKRDMTATIVEREVVAPDHVWMRLSCAWSSDSAMPGQFVHLRLPDSDDPFLRRPYTIYRADADSLDILFQVLGHGTALLAARPVGAEVRILAPLGAAFSMPPKGATALVVGGGVGMASLYLLVERLLKARVSTRVLLGSRSRAYVLCRDDLEGLGAQVDVSTDDGSEGFHGFVTELMRRVLDNEAPPNPHVYTCGPTAMMRGLAKLTEERDVPTQVALENRMGCGLGVCLGCVVPVLADGATAYERVCTEGPVFDARRVQWGYRI